MKYFLNLFKKKIKLKKMWLCLHSSVVILIFCNKKNIFFYYDDSIFELILDLKLNYFVFLK